MLTDNSELVLLNVDVDSLIERKIREGRFGKKIFCTVYYSGASEKTRRYFLTWLIANRWITINVGKGTAKAACSDSIYPKCIDDFLRTCCLFKNKLENLPEEFPLGRTIAGTPIRIKLSENFKKNFMYDEVIRPTFLLFCLF